LDVSILLAADDLGLSQSHAPPASSDQPFVTPPHLLRLCLFREAKTVRWTTRPETRDVIEKEEIVASLQKMLSAGLESIVLEAADDVTARDIKEALLELRRMGFKRVALLGCVEGTFTDDLDHLSKEIDQLELPTRGNSEAAAGQAREGAIREPVNGAPPTTVPVGEREKSSRVTVRPAK
jgi:hypothetical protein